MTPDVTDKIYTFSNLARKKRIDMPVKRILSKSRLKLGMQCRKALYYKLFRPELEGEVDTVTQAVFDSGNEVGDLARKHFGKGVLIDFQPNQATEAARKTAALIEKGEKTIYEASFLGGGISCKVDIFHRPTKRSGWQLIEVKQSVETKEEHIIDVAVQAIVLSRSGIEVESYQLMHLNRECYFPDLSNLFIRDDITEEVLEVYDEVEETIESLLKIPKMKTAPRTGLGPHCHDPYDCPFTSYCWKGFPNYSVMDLPGMGKKAWEYYNQGKKLITDLRPTDFKGKTRRAIEVTKSGKIFLDREIIRAEMKKWAWPLYFLDFETINPAIPRYEGTRPYSQVPFQYSCHIWKSPDMTELQHFEHLHTDRSDPRVSIAKSLCDGFGKEGSIVAYNKGFESGVLKKLAELFPKYRRKLIQITDRLVDPLPLFREGVYHPDFRGSFSIKAVAPALIGDHLKYDDLDVAHGQEAQVVVDALMRGQIPEEKIESYRQNLLAYCRQDTLAMVELVKWMIKEIKF